MWFCQKTGLSDAEFDAAPHKLKNTIAIKR